MRPAQACATPGTLRFEVRLAASSAERRAAAYLRAQSFAAVPEGRSDFARRAHLRMKADAAWEALEAQAAGADAAYAAAGCAVATLVACAPDDGGAVAAALRAALGDGSAALPARGAAAAEVVVGTLDLNQGAKLPAEELIGRLPAAWPGAPGAARAYLSNVCVLDAARRRGVARALILEAAALAAARGVGHLYVHVVAGNAAAQALYERGCGFAVEQEEPERAARALNRPRRLLLHRRLGGAAEP
jgi:ribosomal protein S18 acetylase RimI-like enzyme